MIRRLFIKSLFCVFCLAAAPAHAVTFNPMDSCPSEIPSASIRIALSLYDPPVYQNYSINDLTHFPTGASPYPSDAITHTYGITRNPLRFLGRSQIESSTNMLTKKKCYWYKGIDLTIEVKPQIYLGREIKQGTCYYNAVLRHELQHANIERKLLTDYQPIITATITQFVRNIGAIKDIDVGQDDAIYDKFQALLDQQLEVIHQHMEPVREARQAEIDTRESYEATAAPCRAVEVPPL